MPVSIDILKKLKVLENVSDAVVNEIAANATQRTYVAGEFLIRERDTPWALWATLSGVIRIYYLSPSGDELTVKIFRGASVFGDMEYLSDVPYFEYVEAIEPVESIVIPLETYISAIGKSREFLFNLYKDMARRFCIAAHNERSLAFDSVDTRVASFLTTLADYTGEPLKNEVRISLPLSQESISLALGVNRRSITRALKALTSEGILRKAGKYFVISSYRALLARSNPDLIGITYNVDMRLKTIGHLARPSAKPHLKQSAGY